MALIKNPLNPFWRSKDGSLVLQLQWFGAGGRNNVVPTNRRHEKQGIRRLDVVRVYNVWRSLTVAQKDLWDTFSTTYTTINKYGDTIVIGGFQWYCKFNLRLINYDSALILTPPPNPTPSYDPSFAITQIGVGGPLQVTPSPVMTGNNKIFVWRKLNENNAVSKPPKPLVSFGYFNSSDSTPYIIAGSNEMDFSYRRMWFGFNATDTWGRAPDMDFDSWVSVSGP